MKGRRRGRGRRVFVIFAVAALWGWALAWVSAPAMAEDIAPGPPGHGVVVTDTGLVLPVREVREGGFVVTTPCWREGFVRSGAHVTDVDIVLDPGHGGSETGAVGPGGLTEKDLNLRIARKAAGYLEARGYSVLLTRTTDIRIPVVVRAEIARALQADVFVSIHHNGGTTRRSSDPGTETYHQAANPDSRRLAGILYEEIHGALSRYDIAWRDTAKQGANATVRKRDGKDLYGILQYTPGMTSVITEAAYLSNRAEARLLSDPAVQAVEASAIADGIDRYLTTADPGAGYNGTVVTSRRLYSGSPGGCADPPLETGTPPGDADPARYRDVTEAHLAAVEFLSGEGVLDGADCGSGLFCPDAHLRRWELAVWLVRTIEAAEPAPVRVTRFADLDADEWWSPHVERLFDRGITRGCAIEPARFCPDRIVTRGQLASFVVRAFDLAGPTEPSHWRFDLFGAPHAATSLMPAGLLQQCGTDPPRYCPHHPATRGQAATLLSRAQAHAAAHTGVFQP